MVHDGIWKEYYDEETKRIEIVNTLGSTNLYDSDCGYFLMRVHATNAVNKANEDVSNGKLFVRKCKCCDRYYYATPDEDEWFVTRGLSVPKRCPICRRKRK